ncbi:hypothetical protein P3553_22440, partial [Vibrio parahaemolyticus]|nr:hypothetical protein [Vibrio parahaemolyticus]
FVQFCFHLDSQALKKTGNTKEFAAKRQALPHTSVAKLPLIPDLFAITLTKASHFCHAPNI